MGEGGFRAEALALCQECVRGYALRGEIWDILNVAAGESELIGGEKSYQLSAVSYRQKTKASTTENTENTENKRKDKSLSQRRRGTEIQRKSEKL